MSVLVSAYRATLGRGSKLIAVTGSFGKTTTTRAIAAVLGRPTALENVPNANSRLHLQALRQMRGGPIGVVEIGIGRPNRMRHYARAIRPQIAVVTSIGLEHEGFFPDGLDGIRNEKAELVRVLPRDGVAVLNRDDPRVMWMAQQTQANIVTFGRHEEADVVLLGIETEATGSRLRLRVAGAEHEVRTALIGSISGMPVAAAVAAAHAAGIDVQAAARAVARLPPTLRRLEPVRLPSGAVALLDDTKGTPATAVAAFDAAADIACRRRLAVLGRIPKTTPEPTRPVYEALGVRAGQVFDRIFFIHLDDEPYETYRRSAIDAGLDASRIARVRTVEEAARVLRDELRPGDVLLLKGHFTDHLSRVVMALQGLDVRCRLQSCKIRSSDWCNVCSFVLDDLA